MSKDLNVVHGVEWLVWEEEEEGGWVSEIGECILTKHHCFQTKWSHSLALTPSQVHNFCNFHASKPCSEPPSWCEESVVPDLNSRCGESIACIVFIELLVVWTASVIYIQCLLSYSCNLDLFTTSICGRNICCTRYDFFPAVVISHYWMQISCSLVNCGMQPKVTSHSLQLRSPSRSTSFLKGEGIQRGSSVGIGVQPSPAELLPETSRNKMILHVSTRLSDVRYLNS